MNREDEVNHEEHRAVDAMIAEEREAELEAERYTQPFCACGRIVGECDGSRRGCRTMGSRSR